MERPLQIPRLVILRTSSLSVLPSMVQSSQHLLQRVSRLGLCTSHSPACDMALLLTWFPPTLPPGHRVRRASPFGHPRASPGPTPEVEGRPLGLTAVIATCLVSSVTALGLLSGWTVSPLRGEIGSPDPQQLALHGVWLIFMEWMKNGLQSPLLFLLSCGPSACRTVCEGLQKMTGSWREKKHVYETISTNSSRACWGLGVRGTPSATSFCKGDGSSER